jgi:prephenate dehydrogenase
LSRAKSLGSVQEISTDLSAVRGADIVILAAPVDSIVPLAKKIKPHLSPSALVMDVGSAKETIVTALDRIFSDKRGPQFIGAHPMAGSDKTGVANARAELFKGAVSVLTPGRRSSREALLRAESFWRGVGARTLQLKPAQHDAWIAIVSHLPHLAAFSLSLTAARSGASAQAMIPRLAAGSFRDMTRVSGADPEQWSSIFKMNAKHLRRAAADFSRSLNEILGAKRPAGLLGKAKKFRDHFFNAQRKN